MAELNDACCSTDAQATCCDPADKSTCCNPGLHPDGACGCAAGARGESDDDVREAVRARYAAAARGTASAAAVSLTNRTAPGCSATPCMAPSTPTARRPSRCQHPSGAASLASSYAIGDYFGFKYSLHRGWRDATTFHGTYAAFIALAAVLVLIPGAPLGLITTGVQALAGILLPSATVFLLLLCNDHDVLGPWVNPRWLNALSALVVGVLVVLSTLLTITTLFPDADVTALSLVLFGALALTLGALATTLTRRPRPVAFESHRNWTMPQLETLSAPTPSRNPSLALVVLRCQLLLAGALLVARVIQLGIT